MKKLLLACAISYGLCGVAQETDSSSTAITLDASYVGDFVYNMHGGLQQGGVFLGMASLGMLIETEKLGLWKHGSLHIHGKSLHGKSPSEQLVGDFQVLSNIDGGEHTYLHEFWYSQTIGISNITVGLQDANVELVTSAYGSHFINSSFGIPSLIADNVPIAIFPLTNLGITFTTELHEKLRFVAAVYDGKPTHFDINRYNTDWKLQKEDGILSFVEFQYRAKETHTYKLGYYNHSGLQEFNDSLQKYNDVFTRNYGVYGIIDQKLWQQEESKQSFGIFVQGALSPKSINEHSVYIGGGAVYSGLGGRENVLGLAIAHARFNAGLVSETAIELSYKAQLFSNVSIQPDVQYIIKPYGVGSNTPNALVGILRFTVEL